MRALALEVLLFILFIGIETQGQPGEAPPAPPSPQQNTTTPVVVCAGADVPLVMCDKTEPASTFTGFAVELYRLAAAKNNWVENVDYVFKCVLEVDIMIDELKFVNGTCDVGIGAIVITTEREDQGIQFTYPIYNTGLSILVKTEGRASGGWAFFQPFALNLWLAVGLTLVIFPTLLFLIEFGSLKRRIYLQDAIRGIEKATLRACKTLVMGWGLEVSSRAAFIFNLFFFFMVLILRSTYTANLAATLTVNQINSQITSMEELRGKAVITNSAYSQKLRSRYGIRAFELNEEEYEDQYIEAAKDIINGELTALITDAPLLENFLVNTPGCAVRQLSDALIEPYSYGFGVKNGIDPVFVDDLSKGILKLQEDGNLQVLIERFLDYSARNDCGDYEASTYSINFYNLYGLWVLLGAGLIIGFVLMMVARLRRKKLQQRDLMPLEGTSKEAKANGLQEQHQKQQQDTSTASVGSAPGQASMQRAKPTTTAAGNWKKVPNKISDLQVVQGSFFPSSTWQSEDDIELQKTVEESSDKE